MGGLRAIGIVLLSARIAAAGDAAEPLPAGALARLGTARFREPGAVNALAFAPDGKTLAAGVGDCTSVHLLDAASGRRVAALRAGSHQVLAVACLPDGKFVIGGDRDGTVRVWDVTSGAVVRELHGKGYPHTIALSPDGRIVAWPCDRGNGMQIQGDVRLSLVASGEEVRTLRGAAGSSPALAFAPDGRLLAATGTKGIVLFDAATGAEVRALPAGRDEVESLAFSPDGAFLAAAAHDVTVYDVATGKPLRTLVVKEQNAVVRAVAFSRDGKLLVSGNWDGTEWIWDAASGNELRRLPHGSQVCALAFSPDGRVLATGSMDGLIRLWDPASGERRSDVAERAEPVTAAAFSRNDGALALGGGAIRLWDWRGGEAPRELASGLLHTSGLAFTADGKILVAGTLEDASQRKLGAPRVLASAVRRWELPSGAALPSFALGAEARPAATSPDGAMLALLEDAGVVLREAASGKALGTLDVREPVARVVFAADGATIACALVRGGIRLTRLSGGKDLPAPKAAQPIATGLCCETIAPVLALAFSRDAKTLAIGGVDGRVRLVEVATGNELRGFATIEDAILAVAFAGEGAVVTGHQSGALRAWDAASGRPLRALEGHGDAVAALATSPDGKRLVSGSLDGTAIVWDVARLR